MTTLEWRLARHPADQAALDRFCCADPDLPRPRNTARHPEPHALEAERLLRGLLRTASRNSRRRGWRYLVAEDDKQRLAAGVIHRGAPDFTGGAIPAGVPVRLLLVAGLRFDLRGGVNDSGRRHSDDLMETLLVDASRLVRGGLLLGRVHPDNARSRAMLTRHGFEPLPDATEYLTYVRAPLSV